MVKPDELITGRQMGPRGTVGAEQRGEPSEHTSGITLVPFYLPHVRTNTSFASAQKEERRDPAKANPAR